jgi:hypothetical protein
MMLARIPTRSDSVSMLIKPYRIACTNVTSAVTLVATAMMMRSSCSVLMIPPRRRSPSPGYARSVQASIAVYLAENPRERFSPTNLMQRSDIRKLAPACTFQRIGYLLPKFQQFVHNAFFRLRFGRACTPFTYSGISG